MWWASFTTAASAAELSVGPEQTYATFGEALDAAVSGDVIRVDPGLYQEDVDFRNVVGIEIVGAGSDPLTGTVFSGGDGTSLWLLEATSLVIRDLVLDGEDTRRPLTVQAGSTLEATNVRVQNGSQPFGGGVHVDGSTLRLASSLVFSNRTTGDGAGLNLSNGAVADVEGTRFSNNTGGAEGGGIRVGPGTSLELRRSSLFENTATIGGGLACASAARCLVEDTEFERNLTVNGGAGMYTFGVPDVQVLRTTFCANASDTASGGGLTVQDSTATVRNSVFLEGEAAIFGGGVFVRNSVLALANNTFLGDHAASRGGALYQDGATETTAVNNLFVACPADVAPFAAVDVFQGTFEGGYSLYWDNVANRFPAVSATDLVGPDPALVPSETCAAPVPLPASPTFDAGDPTILDPDGSRSDIGATGGPLALRDRDGDGSVDGLDCDDGDPDRAPDAAETCNGTDDDCNGLVDEGCDDGEPETRDPAVSEPEDGGVGCSCDTSTGAAGWLLLLGGAWGLRRRR